MPEECQSTDNMTVCINDRENMVSFGPLSITSPFHKNDFVVYDEDSRNQTSSLVFIHN